MFNNTMVVLLKKFNVPIKICPLSYQNQRSRKICWWCNVPKAPPDAILGITDTCKKDTKRKKIDLGVGAYRDDEGNPYELPCVEKACEIVAKDHEDHEYQSIGGDAGYCKLVAQLALGNSCAISDNRCCTVQSLGGTGALSLGGKFLDKFYKASNVIYLPTPTWANHQPIFEHCNLTTKSYRYYDHKTKCLNFKCMLADICKMPENSIILLHACAHNPTGLDPTREQWKEISEVVKKRKLFPFFDMAYQGLASGDLECDAFAPRRFLEDDHNIALAQSFSANLGLYGERMGALTFTCDSEEEAQRIKTQLDVIIRKTYSNPPLYGMRIVRTVLCCPELNDQWLCDIKGMHERIMCMRKSLVSNLESAGSCKDWGHICRQVGIFGYTGMTSDQVRCIIKDYSVYLTQDGRMSMAGVNCCNVKYLANAMHEVTK